MSMGNLVSASCTNWKNIKVNATAALSLRQVILSAKAGVTDNNVFTGKVSDEGGNAPELITNSINFLTRSNYKSELIVGSIRSVGDILSAAIAGAHIITFPPQFLDEMADHMNSRAAIRHFINDAEQNR